MTSTVPRRRARRFVPAIRRGRAGLRELGPGLITGVADDDPSGISTYTVTGATQGYRLLWLSIATLPMNVAVQSACARIGLVTGHGLAGAIARCYGRRWLGPVVALLLVANIVNIGADILGVAAAIELLTGVPARWLVAPLGLGIALVEVVVPYQQFARGLKWLTLVVFAYVVGAFFAHPNWGAALSSTLVPRVRFDSGEITTIVAILGTTISPYLFFWQTSEEVEEEREHGIDAERLTADELRPLLRAARTDIGIGMALANVGFYFVVLTSAAALYAPGGGTTVTTAAQAAAALRPLAGSQATLLFALGIIGTGLLAVPVLAGSGAYAVAELFDWPEGLSHTFRRAPQFYGVIALATLLGVGLTFSGLGEIRALYIAAIVNGAIAPLLLIVIMRVVRDRAVLGDQIAGRGIAVVGWLTTAIMLAAALAMAGVYIWG